MSVNLILYSIVILYAVFGFYWILSFFTGAPYYPSNKKAIETMVKASGAKKGLKIAELGSGDGRVAIALAKAGADVTAIEINPFLTLISRIFAKLRGVDIKVMHKNILGVSYHNFDVAIVYLYPGIMKKLEEKLYKEMPKGSKIISNTFRFKNKQPEQIIDNRILVYEVE